LSNRAMVWWTQGHAANSPRIEHMASISWILVVR
jgi:hypothetical protein